MTHEVNEAWKAKARERSQAFEAFGVAASSYITGIQDFQLRLIEEIKKEYNEPFCDMIIKKVKTVKP